jgi:hypothetical protein
MGTCRQSYNEPAFGGGGGGNTYQETLAESVTAIDGVNSLINGLGDDSFSQESIYTGGAWTTTVDLNWSGLLGLRPAYAFEYANPDGTAYLDQSFPHPDQWKLTAAVTAGDSTIYVTGPTADTTLTAAANAGDTSIQIPDTTSWLTAQSRFTINGDPAVYTAVGYGSTGTVLALSRPLANSYSAGATVNYKHFVEPGDTMIFSDNDGPGSWEEAVVQSRTHTSVTFTAPLTNNYLINRGIGPKSWVRNSSWITDPLYPGLTPVINIDIPLGYAGGYSSGSVIGSPLTWSTGLFTDELYCGLWWRMSPGYDHQYQAGTKILYWGSPLNGTAHMMPGAVTDWPLGNEGYPTHIPQNPFDRADPPFIPANDMNDGDWHRIEFWLKANTGGNQDGLLKGWLDGNLNIDRTNMKFFNAGDTRDFSRVDLLPIWGGGLNYCRQNQWVRYGRILARVK